MWRVDLYNDATKETTPHSYPTEAEAEAAFVVLQAAHPKRLVLMWEDGVPADAAETYEVALGRPQTLDVARNARDTLLGRQGEETDVGESA